MYSSEGLLGKVRKREFQLLVIKKGKPLIVPVEVDPKMMLNYEGFLKSATVDLKWKTLLMHLNNVMHTVDLSEVL